MTLGEHLLQTCLLRKASAVRRARAEAEWWECRIRRWLRIRRGRAAKPEEPKNCMCAVCGCVGAQSGALRC